MQTLRAASFILLSVLAMARALQDVAFHFLLLKGADYTSDSICYIYLLQNRSAEN